MFRHTNPHKAMLFRKDDEGHLWVILPGELGRDEKDCKDMPVLATEVPLGAAYIDGWTIRQMKVVRGKDDIAKCFRLAWHATANPGELLPEGKTHRDVVEDTGLHLRTNYETQHWLAVRRQYRDRRDYGTL